MTGHYLHLIEKRDAVLSSARLSPTARARIMGRPTYPGAISYTPPLPPLQILEDDDPPCAKPKPKPVAKYGVREILNVVAAHWGVRARPLLGREKARHFSRPRFAVVLLMKEKLLLSNNRIAHCFNRESDASGHDMVSRARELLATDPEWAALYRAAEHALDAK